MTDEKNSLEKEKDEGGILVSLTKSVPNVIDQLIGGSKKRKTYGLEEHPLDLAKLPKHIERSGILQPDVKAYNVNVHTTGYGFKAAVDLNAPDALEEIKDALFVEKLVVAHEEGIPLENINDPSDAEIEAKYNEVKKQARLELALAYNFFESCVPDGDFYKFKNQGRL